jgi:hypothetical protein
LAASDRSWNALLRFDVLPKTGCPWIRSVGTDLARSEASAAQIREGKEFRHASFVVSRILRGMKMRGECRDEMVVNPRQIRDFARAAAFMACDHVAP